MKTFTRTLMLVVLMLAVANVYAQKGEGDDKLKKKIQATNNKMVKAMIADDTEKMLSFYHFMGHFFPANGATPLCAASPLNACPL